MQFFTEDDPKEFNDTKRVTYNGNKGTYNIVMEKIKYFQENHISVTLCYR